MHATRLDRFAVPLFTYRTPAGRLALVYASGRWGSTLVKIGRQSTYVDGRDRLAFPALNFGPDGARAPRRWFYAPDAAPLLPAPECHHPDPECAANGECCERCAPIRAHGWRRRPVQSTVPRVRFWDWINGGPVRLSLALGETLEWGGGAPDEEGYSAFAQTWRGIPGGVFCEWSTWGRDCDGPHQSGGEAFCLVSRLGAGARGAEGGWPAWQATTEWQRDHYAEAAGY